MVGGGDGWQVLGKGSFGKVMLVRYKGAAGSSSELFAMKTLRKEALIRRNQVPHPSTTTMLLLLPPSRSLARLWS